MVSRNQLLPISQLCRLLKADGDAAGIPWLIGPGSPEVRTVGFCQAEKSVRMIRKIHLSMDWFKGKFTGKPHI